MKSARLLFKSIALVLVASLGTGCMTTYDAYGRPVQSVDPGLAIAGAAAAGLVGYAIAKDRHGHHDYGRGHGRYYRPHGYRSYGHGSGYRGY